MEAARDEILDLSHRIHANPEPAFEEHKAAEWVAEVLEGHGFEVERPVGSLATAVRARLAGGRGTDGPRIGILAEYDALPGTRATAAATTRWRRPGVGAAIALAAVRDAFAGRDRVPRHARGGAGERQADHDRGRAVRRPRRGAAVPPVRPQPRRHRAARVRGRHDRVQGAAVACRLGPVARAERAGRDDLAVRERRPVAPAAAAGLPGPRDHPGGRDRGEHHPGPDARLVHGAQRRTSRSTRR